jgi:hypothetical protein
VSRSVIESTVGVNGTAEMDSRLVQGHGPVFSQVAWQPRCENSSKRGVLTWGGAHRLQKPQEPQLFRTRSWNPTGVMREPIHRRRV